MNENDVTPLHKRIVDETFRRAGVSGSSSFISKRTGKRMLNLPAMLPPLDGSSYDDQFIDSVKENFAETFNRTLRDVSKTSHFRSIFYEEIYKGLKEYYEKEQSWQKLLFEGLTDDEDMFDAVFVKLVEENTGKTITSIEKLQEATGIYEIDSCFYQAIHPENTPTPPLTKKQRRSDAELHVMITFFNAMRYRYQSALEFCLSNGGKYQDLLNINPESFNLIEAFREHTIPRAIQTFIYDVPTEPDIRSLAESLEAPYSLLIKAKQLPEKAV
jgi:hypothetical protein